MREFDDCMQQYPEASTFGAVIVSPDRKWGVVIGDNVLIGGDANSDGNLDLSDAVFSLNFLFLGGLPPLSYVVVGLDDPRGSLPASGQRWWFDSQGEIVFCVGPEIPPGQDGFLRAGCEGEGRFMDTGDGSILDFCTGLEWQKAVPRTPNGAVRGFDWEGALKYCDGLTLAGESEWRLPNVRELQSIVDYGRNPFIAPEFEGVAGEFWSSTSFTPDPLKAFTVDFRTGGVNPQVKKRDDTSLLPVRAVRAGRFRSPTGIPACRLR